jgi:hypothetical protein
VPCTLLLQVVELDETGAVTKSQQVPTALIHKGDLFKVRGDLARLMPLAPPPPPPTLTRPKTTSPEPQSQELN